MPDGEALRPDAATRRHLSSGPVIGGITAAGAHAWLGLPFAAPPTGPARWRSPRPVTAWKDERAATAHAERCAQVTNPWDEAEGHVPGTVIGTEDCLYLDVYAPPDASGRGLPVMVWIHGGGNVWGRASSYDPSALVVREDVVVVTVQYRLGPFGWLSHEALRADAETDLDGSANFALLDLVKALEWVRDEGARFGGDPGNVTIFGESAGGHNVASLLASPLARGLFHRAIVQSGYFESMTVAEAEGREGAVPNASDGLLARLGTEDAEALRALPASTVLAACRPDEQGVFTVPRAIRDGIALPKASVMATLTTNGAGLPVPLIVGTNRDELKLFLSGREDLVRKRLGLFPVPRDRARYDGLSRHLSDWWQARAVDGPASLLTGAGHRDVFAYRFDWDEGGRAGLTDLSALLGASHAMEIPFVFGRFRFMDPIDRHLFPKRTAGSRAKLSEAMGAYWANFARTGRPGDGGRGLPRWERWTEGGLRLVLDTEAGGGIRLEEGRTSEASMLERYHGAPDLTDEDRRLAADAARPVWPEKAYRLMPEAT